MAKQDATIAVEVVDSAMASLALGWMAIAAAQAAATGAGTEEILSLIESIKQRTSLYFVVDTLEYLQRNGRIGKASALLGSLLSVKPILSLQDGVVTPVEKVRGSSRALERMISLAKVRHELHTQPLHVGVLHAAAPQAAERLADQIRQELHPKDLIISELGSVLGTHVGPNTVGITIVPW
jgi:DegV family protein with EDD domain